MSDNKNQTAYGLYDYKNNYLITSYKNVRFNQKIFCTKSLKTAKKMLDEFWFYHLGDKAVRKEDTDLRIVKLKVDEVLK